MFTKYYFKAISTNKKKACVYNKDPAKYAYC